MKAISISVPIATILWIAVSLTDAVAGGIPGTRERITFEGLVGRHSQNGIPGGYDGFGWGNIYAVGKGLYKDHLGFQSVVHGKVGAVNLDGTGLIVKEDNGFFSIRSGDFAAFGSNNVEVTFDAYSKGVLVGTLELTLPPQNTLVKFDHMFSNIDRLEIQGGVVAMDNLHVSF